MRRADRKQRRSYWWLAVPVAVVVLVAGTATAGGAPSEALRGLIESLAALVDGVVGLFKAFLTAG